MKQILLFTLFSICTSLSVAAQQLPVVDAAKSATTNVGAAAIPQLGGYDKVVVADTLFPTILAQPCSDSVTNFVPNDPATGFVGGTNSFFDLRKLQRVSLSEATNLTVSEVLVAFSVADDNISDRAISAEIFADLDADGNLGALIGTSDTITVGDLIVPENGIAFTSFNFSTPVELTDASSFLISVNFTDLYFNAQDSVDYTGNAAIWSTNNNCGDGSNALEIFPAEGGGLGFGTILADWGLNVEFLMGAVIDRDPFVATRNPIADYGTSVSPNPAFEQLNISFNAPTSERMTASLLATDGRVLRKQILSNGAGLRTVNWNVATLPAGVYLYQISGPSGVETGRVVVQ
ncbi:T9SS type A sorting domain-containing protein [Neolewinella aurantiaca]|uniref:T9SS type A sorting domain-containing protein n=1 Tax=Neolewinella aurantiaca TaxID=2602767 RepID=A0A5C7FEB3_9BACT|nr:T9SS type A sorting domain-containing protein [Neolewinella aurantiaca]TXF87829.1 T9SS type A sorting domain-containing protein [Neolewinella aurantiaca]